MSDKLELISTANIMEELGKRYQSFIFHGRTNRNENEDNYYCEWQGGVDSCLGLAEYLKWKVRDDLRGDDT